MSLTCTQNQLLYSYCTLYLVFTFSFSYLLAHLLYLPQSMSCTNHMSGVEWIDTYCIQSCRCPEWDSNPQPIEFHSDAVINWAIRPWRVWHALRNNFVHPLWCHLLFSVQISLWSLTLPVPTFTAHWRHS